MKPSDTRRASAPRSYSSAAAPSRVGASGFSQSTGFPAATQALTRPGWVGSGEAISTASTAGSAISASGSPVEVARTAAATASARTGSASATAATADPDTQRCS
jgi:hypothetical protein